MTWVLIFIFGLLIPFLVTAFFLFDLWSQVKGAPYVATKDRMVLEILSKASALGLKKGQVFLELGSGDGRVVRIAVRELGVLGVGIELNPLLVFYSKILSRFQRLKNIEFKRENFFKIDLKSADIIFLFLMPKTLEKLKTKFLKECSKTLIISHGFKIIGFDQYLIDKIDRKIFPTYYYRIH